MGRDITVPKKDMLAKDGVRELWFITTALLCCLVITALRFMGVPATVPEADAYTRACTNSQQKVVDEVGGLVVGRTIL